jgi:PKHD-type hydroxylase
MSAVLKIAATSPGNERYPFALGLDDLVAGGTLTRSFATLAELRASEMVTTPQVMLEVFSPEECRRIVERCEQERLHQGQISHEQENYRRANAAWITPADNTRWIYERIAGLVAKLNRWYRYDLFGFLEPLHFVRYDAGGKFDWHLDAGGGGTCTRKLSVTVQLSSPGDYDGGGLEFCPQGELHRSRYHGSAIVFPAMLAHRVTPVERGVRRAIVAWIHGPSFR